MTNLIVRAEHLWQERHTPEAKRLFRYTMVSVISSAVSFGTLGLVFGVFHLWGEVGSTVFANVVATVPSYYLTRSWVWGKGGRSHLFKEIIPFWAMAALGIVVSIGGASLAKHFGQTHHLHHLAQTVLVEGANVASFGIFWVLKFLVFNRIFKVHPLEDLDQLVEADWERDSLQSGRA
jgi:putative flippase GtrA